MSDNVLLLFLLFKFSYIRLSSTSNDNVNFLISLFYSTEGFLISFLSDKESLFINLFILLLFLFC